MKKLFSVLLAVLVLAGLFSVTALAADSPSGIPTFSVDINNFASGSKVEADVSTEESASYAWVDYKGEKVLRLRAAAKSDYEFTGWVIDGEYEIVSGTLTSNELMIRVLSDITIEESYDVEGSQGFGSSNKDPEAPETGDVAPFVALFAVVALAGVVVAKKRLAA